MDKVSDIFPNVNNVISSRVFNVINVRATANKLTGKLGDPGSYQYFCKVAWKLPESLIWSHLEQAMGGTNPKAYFTFLCNLSMKESV